MRDTRSEQLFFDARSELDYAHQRMILFKGYSTIPCALAALSFGRSWRTTASSMMVLTATQSGSLRVEIVGFFKAGKASMTPAKCSRRTFSIKPTLLAAAMA